ncbi:MAG: lipoprotein [Candidatus Omnitrophota bacterium]|nr:lipoprotein [Candidatus Omnitrophota bacterium]MDZ4242468.1 lipoprotein [Candidatus Omnitrophota bacterium]
MKKILPLLTTVFVLSGCAKLAHLQELLTLKSYSEEKDAQTKFIESQDKKFEQLLAVVKSGRMGDYPDRKTAVKAFGVPVLARSVERAGQQQDECLYRYARGYLNSDKVYLYFDSSDRLTEWEFVPAPAEISRTMEGSDEQNQDRAP